MNNKLRDETVLRAHMRAAGQTQVRTSCITDVRFLVVTYFQGRIGVAEGPGGGGNKKG